MFELKQAVRETSYWEEKVQNDIYILATEYMKEKGINQTELGKVLGVGRSRVSQILNGRYNPSMNKYISFCLALDKVPIIEAEEMKDYLLKLNPTPPSHSCRIIDMGSYQLTNDQAGSLDRAIGQF